MARWGWAVAWLGCLPLVYLAAFGFAEWRWPLVAPVAAVLVFLGCFLRWVFRLGSVDASR